MASASQLAQEPAVDQAALVDGLDLEAAAEGLEHQVEALGAGHLERLQQLLVGVRGTRAGESSSRERSALAKDSRKVRPIDITSPTLCMWVESLPSAPGNFSKAKRGILVTT